MPQTMIKICQRIHLVAVAIAKSFSIRQSYSSVFMSSSDYLAVPCSDIITYQVHWYHACVQSTYYRLLYSILHIRMYVAFTYICTHGQL